MALKVYFKARVPANVIHMVMREVSIHLTSSEHKHILKLYGVFQVRHSSVRRAGCMSWSVMVFTRKDKSLQSAGNRHWSSILSPVWALSLVTTLTVRLQARLHGRHEPGPPLHPPQYTTIPPPPTPRSVLDRGVAGVGDGVGAPGQSREYMSKR